MSFILGKAGEKLSAGEAYVLHALCQAVSLCPAQHLENHQLPAKLTMEEECSLPDALQTIVNHLSPLLLSRQRPVQIAAFRLLSR